MGHYMPSHRLVADTLRSPLTRDFSMAALNLRLTFTPAGENVARRRDAGNEMDDDDDVVERGGIVAP